ncbi:uncharacterized protein LOC134209329 [Armigeres subalbatus]|uniref:uncharacterized protein LOC134209329 n=1 Tax=Armigeres subalbatus TaxID=124917 RepID=UPI002ED0DAF2
MAPNLRRLAKGERFYRDSLRNLAHLVDEYQDERDSVMLEEWKERLKEIFDDYKDTRVTHPEESYLPPSRGVVPIPVQQIRVKLPEIKLPIFDGTIREWPFRDSFHSLIASNTHLSDVDKFSYLLSSLSKEAKRVVEVIEVTSDNYAVAWEVLEKRFENKYLIVKSYVEALFMADAVKKECY